MDIGARNVFEFDTVFVPLQNIIDIFFKNQL